MKDKVLGMLMGGAIGDALGYEIEFDQETSIFKQYGNNGIQDLESGRISDDTQMTLFTASAMLDEGDLVENIYKAYLNWLKTQNNEKDGTCFLNQYKELYVRRAPGITCLSALESGIMGTIEHPINHSKGCGGIMRVAPIALLQDCELLAAQSAAITHGHSLGFMPCSFFVSVLNKLLYTENSLEAILIQALLTTKELFKDDIHIKELEEVILLSIELTKNKKSDLENIHTLGEGWVGEEALAIALYCSLKYQNDFNKAICVSVNHNGDSDSTGALVGQILGCMHGYSNIDKKWLQKLEIQDIIECVADLLVNKFCQ